MGTRYLPANRAPDTVYRIMLAVRAKRQELAHRAHVVKRIAVRRVRTPADESRIARCYKNLSVHGRPLSGTGLSGMLRALEQAWGRDPTTMIPDVRLTPDPHNVQGGPLFGVNDLRTELRADGYVLHCRGHAACSSG
jgi:hypothetical protein